MKNALLALCFAAALPLAADDNPTVQILKKHIATSRAFTLAVADQMPADQYSFKLTPEQMSFGEQMMHIANADGFFFGKMTGMKAPSFDAKLATKEYAVKSLNAAFDFAEKAVGTFTDAKLKDIVDTGDGKMTGLEGVMLLLDHTTNHRASAEMYLRAKGIKPAEYRF